MIEKRLWTEHTVYIAYLLLEYLRLRRGPGLHSFDIRGVDAHDEIQGFVAPVDGEPVFFRYAFGVFGRDMNLDSTVVI